MTGTMSIMTREGDVKCIWNSGNADEVAVAKKTFADLKAKGYIAYAVKGDGNRGEIITDFDPMQEKIILAPAFAGG